MRGGASEEEWDELFEELNEMLMYPPEDLVQVDAGELHLISEERDTNQLIFSSGGLSKLRGARA